MGNVHAKNEMLCRVDRFKSLFRAAEKRVSIPYFFFCYGSSIEIRREPFCFPECRTRIGRVLFGNFAPERRGVEYKKTSER